MINQDKEELRELRRKYVDQDPPIVDKQHRFYRCPECHRKITYRYSHCSRCGKAIIWDGMEKEKKEAGNNGKKTKAGRSKS